MKSIKCIIVIFSLVIFANVTTYAQKPSAQYVVFLTTKSGTPYELNRPEDFLSQRTIEKREAYQLGYDSLDLPVNPAFVDSMRTYGANVRHTSRWFNFAVIYAGEYTVETIEQLSFVSSTQKVKPAIIATDKNSGNITFSQEQVNGYAPDAAEVQQQIALDFLHKQGYTGRNIRIAIIDAGFSGFNIYDAFDHLFENNRIVATHNFADQNDIYGGHTHGTSVASIMCGQIENTFTGAAPDAEYVLLRSETGATEYIAEEYNWVAAAEFADSLGVDIINSSLGYTTFDQPSQNHTYADLDGASTIISRAAGIAFDKGILVVNSAGNHGNDSWQHISVPSDHPDVLAVGSVDIEGNRSDFSSTGTSQHQYKPDIVACGENAPFVFNDQVYHSNGTSFSSPLVAGAAACLWQAYPNLSNVNIGRAIRHSATLYPEGNNFVGYGLPNFNTAFSILNFAPANTETAEFISAYADETASIHLHIYTPVDTEVDLKIVDMRGKVLYLSSINLTGEKVNEYYIQDVGPGADGQILVVHLKGELYNDTRKIWIR